MDAISDVSRASQIFSSCPPRPPLNEPIDLDELLGFGEALRKRDLHEIITEVKYFDRNKIFINHIDSFVGKYLTLVLSRKDIDKPDKLISIENADILQEDNLDKEKVAENDAKETKTKVPSESQSKGKGKKEKSTSKAKKDLGSLKSGKKRKSSSGKSGIKPVENIENMIEYVCEENITYDTSRLTVAEYYEMMELEPGTDREGYLKEKLGKYTETLELNSSPMQDPSPLKHIYISKSKTSDIEICGTLKGNEIPEFYTQEGVSEIIQISKENEDSFDQITRFGVFIYIVNEDIEAHFIEATWFFNSLLNKIEQIKQNIKPHEFFLPLFILVSSFMTWSLTKPFSSKEPGLPFIEKDYRKRKPHPNYQLLYELEEQVIKAKSNGKMETVILVSGIPYGHEENVLTYFFEKAYHYIDLPIYNSGNNTIPVIHVENIGEIIQTVIKKRDEINLPFLFVKDPFSYTFKEMVKAISNNLGSGCCRIMPNPCAFLEDEITQNIYDQITADITLDSCYPLFKEDDIEWKHGKGFVENIKHIIKEYVDAKNLKPFNIVFYDSVYSNELRDIPKQLSEHYHISYLSPETAVEEYIIEMQEKSKKLEDTENNEYMMKTRIPNNETIPSALGYYEEVIECQADADLERNLEFFHQLNIKSSIDMQNLTTKQKVHIIKEKMKKRICLNKGYILHNFPNTLEEAKLLYCTGENHSFGDSPLLPDCVVWLNEMRAWYVGTTSTNSSEKNKEFNEGSGSQKEDSVDVIDKEHGDYKEHKNEGGTAENESIELKSQSVDECLALQFLLANNENCQFVRIDLDDHSELKGIFERVLSNIEETNNSTETELDDSSGSVQKSTLEQYEKEKLPKDDKNIEKNIDLNGEILDRDFTKLKEAEEIILANRSYPLLRYLINFVYPTLTNAILEVTAQRPEDPLDFLAEYLFKNNPDGRMMDPNESKLKEEMRNQELPLPQIGSKECLA